MVRQDEAVDAEIDQARGVLNVLHALHDELARPHAADDVEVVVADGRVHRGVEQFTDGAAGGAERGELELGRGEEVEPPPRPRDGVDDRADRELGRDREPVALVAQARAGDGGVDGELQGVEPGRRRPLDEAVRDLALLHDVQLEPVAPDRVRGLHALDRGRAERGERERDAGGRRRGRTGGLALGLHQAGEAGGRDAERQRRGAAEDLARRVDVRGRPQDVGVELDVLERAAGTVERELALGGAVGVVERGLRGAALRDRAQIIDRERGVEAALAGVELGLLELHELEELADLGQLALNHGVSLSCGLTTDYARFGRGVQERGS